MTTYRSHQGFIGLTVAAVVAVCALAIALGFYVKHASELPPDQTATTTPMIAASTTPSRPEKPVTPTPVTVPPPAAASHTTTITSAQADQTYHVQVGDRVVLSLGNNLRWSNATSSDANILAGDETTFIAKARGTATLTATGAPICKPDQACPMFLALFSADIIVE